MHCEGASREIICYLVTGDSRSLISGGEMVTGIISVGIALSGLLISGFALWNSHQARLENRTNVLFRLKIKSLTIAHEVEASWQAVVDEVENAQQRIRKMDGGAVSPMAQDVLLALKEWEKTFREAKALAKRIAEDCDKGFDDWSAKNAADVLRVCISSKITLEQSRDKMRRRFSLLEGDMRGNLGTKPAS